MDYVNPVEALIPGVQGRVLTVLARTEAELTMRSVAELAGVSANQATVVLNRLVRLGLVERLAGEARKIRPAPACLVVFGSFARGDAHEDSDVDVLAVPPSEARVDGGRWTTALGQWSDRAARIAGNPVNLLEATMDELPKLVRREREPWRTIAEKGVVLVGDFPSEIRAAS